MQISGFLLRAILCAMLLVSPALAEQAKEWEVLQEAEAVYGPESDLLTAGLGLSGLQQPVPLPEHPAAPTRQELRRLAIHNAWTALSIPRASGGLGEPGLYPDLPLVPGREVSALLRLNGAQHPFRVLIQLPDRLETESPCLLVAPASGSRGVYGAIALAGPPALSRGCAVAYTDKGAGTDHHLLDQDLSPDLWGLMQPSSEGLRAFSHPLVEAAPDGALAMKHAHSGDHPEADWGRHTLAAAEYGLAQLQAALGSDKRVAVIAVGLSNGAGAALRAAELDTTGQLSAVLAVMPNITPPGAPPLYDYATLAALYQPCALGDAERTLAKPLGNAILAAAGRQRCDSLVEAGLLAEPDPEAARKVLMDAGFDEPALFLGAGNIALDLWRTVASSYAASYLRRGSLDMPCGFGFSAAGANPEQQAAWWATHSGIGPGSGIELMDGLAAGADTALPGLQCLRELWTSETEEAIALRAAVARAAATGKLPDIPVLVIHGREDGLIPAALSARPYVQAARQNGVEHLAYWEIDRAQHFDAFLNVPGLSARLVPILPYGWAGIEHVMATLDGESRLGGDRRFSPPAGQDVLTREQMGL